MREGASRSPLTHGDDSDMTFGLCRPAGFEADEYRSIFERDCEIGSKHAPHGRLYRLSVFDTSRGQLPGRAIRAAHEQHVVAAVENDGFTPSDWPRVSRQYCCSTFLTIFSINTPSRPSLATE